jgi:hypothetical protein
MADLIIGAVQIGMALLVGGSGIILIRTQRQAK